MSAFKRSSRAWFAILALQASGSVYMCYTAKSGSSHFVEASPELSRCHALPVAILLILRICLIFNFDSGALHIVHIISSLLSAVHTTLEVFLYKSMKNEIANITELSLNAFTAFLMIGFFDKLIEEEEPEEPVRRKKQVTAKHYMEGKLLTPPEDDELVQKYKKSL